MDIQSLIKQDFLLLEENLTLNKAISSVGTKGVFVVRKGKFVGIPDYKKILRTRLDVTVTKLRGNVQKTSVVSAQDSVLDIADVFAKNNVEYLPVVEDGAITGVLFAKDVVLQALTFGETKQWKVGDCTLIKNFRLKEKDSVAAAIDMMHEQKVDHLPLVEQGEIIGVVSYKDVLRKYLAAPPRREHSTKTIKPRTTRGADFDTPHLASLPISNFATEQNVVSVLKNDSVLAAVEAMQNKNIASVVVMDGNKYVGLLTVSKILQRIASLVIKANFDLDFVGLGNLKITAAEKKLLQKVAYHQAFRLQRSLHVHFALILTLKQSTANGRQHLYHAGAKLEAPGLFLRASREDWDLMQVVYTIFASIETELQKKNKV